MNWFSGCFLALVLVSVNLSAADNVAVTKRLTKEQEFKAIENNIRASQLYKQRLLNPFRATKKTAPFAEYLDAGYLIFSENEYLKSGVAKQTMALNLPQNMELVVYTSNSDLGHQRSLFKKYSKFIDPVRLKVINLNQPGRDGFWARDGVPVPVWDTELAISRLALVDAQYYHQFEPDEKVSQFFGAQLFKHQFQYEGGNYLANSKGQCIIVNNNRVKVMPDSVFSELYGCKSLTRLPHIKGIGHVDESVKFINDHTVITDDDSYRVQLENIGLKVVMMPRPQNSYETYVNSLMVNGVVFVPTFGQVKDSVALDIYKSFGLKVVALDSSDLSNKGLGSIHCITMVYPPVSFNSLLQHINSKNVNNEDE